METALPEENRRIDEPAARWASVARIVGLVGVALSIVLAFFEGWDAFFRGYVLNFAFVLSFALGALFFVIIQHLTRAGWSVVVRRLAEFVTAAMPMLALLFIPVLIPVVAGMEHVYPWASTAVVEHDALLQWKAPYLNAAFFIARCAVYFAVWMLLARYFVGRSLEQDETGRVDLTLGMQRWSGIATVAFALTTTFFAFDVLMSLAPHWFSTIFGVYFFVGSMVGFFALLALMMCLVQQSGRLTRSITVEHYHDLGKLVFGFTVFWAYIAFSQYMLIWYANMPEETLWYQVRQGSAWWAGVSLVLLFGHFLLPFLLLISRWPKRRKSVLAIPCIWMLLMHWVDVYYLVAPQVHAAHGADAGHPAPFHAVYVTLLVGLGGLFAMAVLRQMKGRNLMPVRDPRLSESLAFENI